MRIWGCNQTFLVRKDIYEAIGSPDMTTPEGFIAVKKAAEMFPEVDGDPLIPIGAHVFDNEGNVSFDKYLMNFLAIPWEKDGVYYDRYTDPEYFRWLKVFRQLGEEDYLANDIFVDTRTQMEESGAGPLQTSIFGYADSRKIYMPMIRTAFIWRWKVREMQMGTIRCARQPRSTGGR